jgi:aminopeptidase-like protein
MFGKKNIGSLGVREVRCETQKIRGVVLFCVTQSHGEEVKRERGSKRDINKVMMKKKKTKNELASSTSLS